MLRIWTKSKTTLIYFLTDSVTGTALSVHNALTFRKVLLDKNFFDKMFLRNNLPRYETGAIMRRISDAGVLSL